MRATTLLALAAWSVLCPGIASAQCGRSPDFGDRSTVRIPISAVSTIAGFPDAGGRRTAARVLRRAADLVSERQGSRGRSCGHGQPERDGVRPAKRERGARRLRPPPHTRPPVNIEGAFELAFELLDGAAPVTSGEFQIVQQTAYDEGGAVLPGPRFGIGPIF